MGHQRTSFHISALETGNRVPCRDGRFQVAHARQCVADSGWGLISVNAAAASLVA